MAVKQLPTCRDIEFHRQAGFTLFEVIAVLVIAALTVGALTFVTRPTSGRAQLSAVAGTVAAGLRHTRGRAIKRGRELVARINVAQKRISWDTERVPLTLQRNIEIKATTAKSEIDGATAGIRFFPNGSSTGGRLQLTSNGTRYDVAVNWLTGRVSIEQDQ